MLHLNIIKVKTPEEMGKAVADEFEAVICRKPACVMGLAADIPAMCEAYERRIEDWGGVDIQLLGLGHDGHIGFNEPCDHFPVITYEVQLTEMTREANKRFFDSLDDVPTAAITMGVGTVMAARKTLLIATGADKADILYKVFFGPVTPEVPRLDFAVPSRCHRHLRRGGSCHAPAVSEKESTMNYLGITYSLKNQPLLDKDFIPFGVWAQAYLKDAAQPFRIAVERENGLISVFETRLRSAEFAEANARFVERLVKMLLWSVGGWRVYLCGDDAVAKQMQDAYRAGGKREFDVGFMQDVYERPFEIVVSDEAHFPAAHEQTRKAGGHTNGCRIGFDAGGSDRKVSAVVDGKTVYSEEVVWHPKTSEDPQYQYDGIVDAFKTAASKMPRVDGIGVSSAGVFIGNAPMVSSIFLKVPRSRREEVKTIFDRAAKEIGDVPIVVANDGDVSALSGAMSLHEGAVMGLAMGTSEAVGYVNADSNLLGWFSELAFAPVDLNEHAMRDEWSGDIGVGCKYFSQDAVIKLAPAAGIALAESLTPAEKLKEVQKLAEQGVSYAQDIFKSIGVYLGHTLCLYEMLYDIRNLIVLGRVASGVGGDLIVAECQRVLNEEYPELSQKLRVMLPDEEFRRVGQSMAAASLPGV